MEKLISDKIRYVILLHIEKNKVSFVRDACCFVWQRVHWYNSCWFNKTLKLIVVESAKMLEKIIVMFIKLKREIEF